MAKDTAIFSAFDAFNEESGSKDKKRPVREPSTEELLFAGSAKNIASKWATQELTLSWTNSTDFMSLALKYAVLLNNGAPLKERKSTRIEIRKTLNALIYLVKANYPDSYHTELKQWGFQKDRY